MKTDKLNEIKDLINKVLVEHDKEMIASINYDDNLRDDLGIDSIEMVDIVVQFDEIYGVDLFSDGDVKKVSEILKLIENEI
jgi:acyl carrier protein